MGTIRDISGMEFGKLKAIKCVGSDKHRHSKWLCKCDCGKETIVLSDALVRGRQISCGCYGKKVIGNRSRTHGKSQTKLYSVWMGIKRRCLETSHSQYKHYGGRGITICDEWRDDFESFYEWSMRNGYEDCLTIDRIDTNGNYEPSNCRWATIMEQNNNTRRNHIITFNGESHTIAEWSRITGISAKCIGRRINRDGWSVEQALTKKVGG